MASDANPGPAVRRRWPLQAAALVAAAFGALTVRAGSIALFAGVDAGAVVPFVLWFNFLAGFAYLLAAVGLWRARPWAYGLAAALAVGTSLVFAAFGLHVAAGGAYETRTAIAMTLRIAVWAAIAALARSELRRLGA